MCGRYDSIIARETYEQLFGVERLPESNFPPRYNVAPTQDIPVVRIAKDGVRELSLVRWGLVPFFMKEMPKVPHINARAETVEKTPLFREAFASRRALIPATGFFEWRKDGKARQPFRIVRRDGAPFAFAGLWEYVRLDGKPLLSATIVVTDANDLLAPIHDRMPVILPANQYATWLAKETPADIARSLLKPFPSALLEAYAVSPLVNKYENDDEAVIAPLVPAQG